MPRVSHSWRTTAPQAAQPSTPHAPHSWCATIPLSVHSNTWLTLLTFAPTPLAYKGYSPSHPKAHLSTSLASLGLKSHPRPHLSTSLGVKSPMLNIVAAHDHIIRKLLQHYKQEIIFHIIKYKNPTYYIYFLLLFISCHVTQCHPIQGLNICNVIVEGFL